MMPQSQRLSFSLGMELGKQQGILKQWSAPFFYAVLPGLGGVIDKGSIREYDKDSFVELRFRQSMIWTQENEGWET